MNANKYCITYFMSGEIKEFKKNTQLFFTVDYQQDTFSHGIK